MSFYRYSARRLTGELISGERAAGSVQDLKQHLSGEGLMLVDARPVGGGLTLPKLGLSRGVKLSALITFVRELRALVGAGMPLSRALAQLETRKDDAVLAAAIASTRSEVEQGRPLDEAMADHPQVFDPLVQATVRAGAATGRLEDALERLLSFLALRHALARKVRRALSYPVFLFVFLAVVLALLMLFVLPRFADLYAEFGADLPTATRVLMGAVQAAPTAIPMILVSIFGAVALFRLWVSAPAARLRVDRLRLALPVAGPILSNTALIQVSFMMAMLLSAGMTLRNALHFTAQSLSNTDIRRRLMETGNDIAAGQSLAAALEHNRIYPDLSRSLLAAGEAAGDLDRMFGEVAKLHEEALEDRLARLIALIEPAMMVIVGVVLGAVIVAVYLPIFGISAVVE